MPAVWSSIRDAGAPTDLPSNPPQRGVASQAGTGGGCLLSCSQAEPGRERNLAPPLSRAMYFTHVLVFSAVSIMLSMIAVSHIDVIRIEYQSFFTSLSLSLPGIQR